MKIPYSNLFNVLTEGYDLLSKQSIPFIKYNTRDGFDYKFCSTGEDGIHIENWIERGYSPESRPRCLTFEQYSRMVDELDLFWDWDIDYSEQSLLPPSSYKTVLKTKEQLLKENIALHNFVNGVAQAIVNQPRIVSPLADCIMEEIKKLSKSL